jgi:hypothetical protein
VTVATLGIAADRLTIRCDDPALDESCDLDSGAKERFEGWAEEYRRALRKETNVAELLVIGRALFAWLDGGAAWLTRLRRDARPPLLLEIAVPLRPAAGARLPRSSVGASRRRGLSPRRRSQPRVLPRSSPRRDG